MLWKTTVLAALALAVTSGCASGRLRQRTINQAGHLPELQYQQVLDNLAQFAVNPAALPWHVNLREGTTQITDSASAGAAVDLGPPPMTLPQIFGSRTVVVQWGMSPVIDATELRLLRTAYRRALGSTEMPDPEFLSRLAQMLKDQFASNSDMRDESEIFYEYQSREHKNYSSFDEHVVTANDNELCPAETAHGRPVSPLARNVCRKLDFIQSDLARIQPGWFQVGRKHDVPKDACYVGHFKDCYVWVGPEGRDALTELTLTILDIASLVKETQTLLSPGSVKFSPGDR